MGEAHLRIRRREYSVTWKDSVSQPPQTIVLSDILLYITSSVPPTQSPIDAFYALSQEILRIGDIPFLTKYPHAGGLLLTGIVSASENYVRDILSAILCICPISQSVSAEEKIDLGAVIWHDPSNALRSAFEHFSFTSSKNILKTCQNYTRIQIDSHLSVFDEFDKLCELRHGVVHSGACLPGRNAVRLQVPGQSGCTVRVTIGFAELQEAGAICTNLVTSINKELFGHIVRRWADDWRKLPSWKPADENPLFRQIWEMFYSKNDADNALIATKMTMRQCRTAVKKEFGI